MHIGAAGAVFIYFEVAIELMLRWVKPTRGNSIIRDISDNM